MMTRVKTACCAAAAALFIVSAASPADAQIRRVDDTGKQSVSFNLGYFALRGEDSRVDGDVLVADLSDVDPLLFDIKDFNGFTFGAEWLVGIGDYLEAGAGIGFYQRTVPSIYADLTHEDGREIEQDLKLRTAPISATVRFLPIGRGGVEPYVGAGIAIVPWRYSETGEFVDTFDGTIFRDTFKADGTAVGPTILGGIRFPVSDVWTVGGELRYVKAEGDIDRAESELLGDKIDLGGWTTSFTFSIRF